MVLSKSELIAALQSEVQILLHLASKIDRTQLDYRPTPKQRSTIELLRYLSLMGPMMLELTVTGTTLDPATAKAAIDGAAARDFDQTLAVIAKHKDTYESLLAGVSDEDFQKDIDVLGNRTTRGAYIIKWILCGCAMYRTQLFLYLKACGREELTSMNLFMGVDAPAAV